MLGPNNEDNLEMLNNIAHNEMLEFGESSHPTKQGYDAIKLFCKKVQLYHPEQLPTLFGAAIKNRNAIENEDYWLELYQKYPYFTLSFLKQMVYSPEFKRQVDMFKAIHLKRARKLQTAIKYFSGMILIMSILFYLFCLFYLNH